MLLQVMNSPSVGCSKASFLERLHVSGSNSAPTGRGVRRSTPSRSFSPNRLFIATNDSPSREKGVPRLNNNPSATKSFVLSAASGTSPASGVGSNGRQSQEAWGTYRQVSSPLHPICISSWWPAHLRIPSETIGLAESLRNIDLEMISALLRGN